MTKIVTMGVLGTAIVLLTSPSSLPWFLSGNLNSAERIRASCIHSLKYLCFYNHQISSCTPQLSTVLRQMCVFRVKQAHIVAGNNPAFRIHLD